MFSTHLKPQKKSKRKIETINIEKVGDYMTKWGGSFSFSPTMSIDEDLKQDWDRKKVERHTDRGYQVDFDRLKFDEVLTQPSSTDPRELINNLMQERIDYYNSKSSRRNKDKIGLFIDGNGKVHQNEDEYDRQLRTMKFQKQLIFGYVVKFGNQEDWQTTEYEDSGKSWYDMAHGTEEEIQAVKAKIMPAFHAFVQSFEEENPNFRIVSNIVQFSEDTPHMQMEIIPWTKTKQKTGISMSFDTALKQQGYQELNGPVKSQWAKKMHQLRAESLEKTLQIGYRPSVTHENMPVNIYKEAKKQERQTTKIIKNDLVSSIAYFHPDQKLDPQLHDLNGNYPVKLQKEEEPEPVSSQTGFKQYLKQEIYVLQYYFSCAMVFAKKQLDKLKSDCEKWDNKLQLIKLDVQDETDKLSELKQQNQALGEAANSLIEATAKDNITKNQEITQRKIDRENRQKARQNLQKNNTCSRGRGR